METSPPSRIFGQRITSPDADRPDAVAALFKGTGPAASPRRFDRVSLVLGLLVLTMGALHYVWLSYNTLPPHWDTANHMISALKYHAVLSQCVGEPDVTLRVLEHCAGLLVLVDQFVYPPLFPLAGGLIIFLAGDSITALAMTNLPFIALLVASMYLLGRTIHSRLAGVLAALLIVAYPLVFQMSREFMLDFATLALAAAAACCLVLSDGFRKERMTVLFGLMVGLGALTKFTLLTYLIGPGLYVFAHLMTNIVRRRLNGHDAARRLVTLAGALALGVAVGALWYGPNGKAFLDSLRTVASLDAINASVLSPPSLAYYPKALIWKQMGPPLFVLFLFGAWRFAAQVTPQRRDFLLVWIGSMYVIATLVSAKGPHNDIGILVPGALISAIGIASLRRQRRAAVAIVSCFVALQLVILTLPGSMLGASVGTFGWAGVVTPLPRAEDWKIESVLRDLVPQRARVAVVSDHLFINGTTLQFYALKNDLPLDVSPCFQLGPGTDPSDFSQFDVVIAKSDDAWIRPKAEGCFRGVDGREKYHAVIRTLEDGSAGFILNQSVALPDGSALLVFGAQWRDARHQPGQTETLAGKPHEEGGLSHDPSRTEDVTHRP